MPRKTARRPAKAPSRRYVHNCAVSLGRKGGQATARRKASKRLGRRR